MPSAAPTKQLRPIPDTYSHGGWEWRLLERIGPWAIYGHRDSVELVKASRQPAPFPPPSESWGKLGFSFNGTGAIERARSCAHKLLNTNGDFFGKSTHSNFSAPVGRGV